MRTSNASYVPAIDHLRALAAILVLFHHCYHQIGGRLLYGETDQLMAATALTPLDALLIEGQTGVALFMVLSGFIFTRICWGRRVNYGRFLLNRVLRIYPLMLVVFAVGWAVEPAAATLNDVIGLLLIPLSISHPIDLWFVPSIYPFTTLFWAIAVEFKFYLLFPALLSLLQRDGGLALWIVLAGAIVLRVLLVVSGASAPDLSYWTIFGRIDQFILGMMAAIYASSTRRQGFLAVVGFAGACGLAFAVNRIGDSQILQATWIIWPTLEGGAWAVFIVGYLHWARHVARRLSAVFAYVGEISFSIYLLHLVIIAAFLKIGPVSFGLDPSSAALLNGLLFVLPATIAIASITYHLIELPFLRMRVRYLGGPIGTFKKARYQDERAAA